MEFESIFWGSFKFIRRLIIQNSSSNLIAMQTQLLKCHFEVGQAFAENYVVQITGRARTNNILRNFQLIKKIFIFPVVFICSPRLTVS